MTREHPVPHREERGRLGNPGDPALPTFSSRLMHGGLAPWNALHRAPRAFAAAWSANRPMPWYFGPGPERPPNHPTSPAPTTRH